VYSAGEVGIEAWIDWEAVCVLGECSDFIFQGFFISRSLPVSFLGHSALAHYLVLIVMIVASPFLHSRFVLHRRRNSFCRSLQGRLTAFQCACLAFATGLLKRCWDHYSSLAILMHRIALQKAYVGLLQVYPHHSSLCLRLYLLYPSSPKPARTAGEDANGSDDGRIEKRWGRTSSNSSLHPYSCVVLIVPSIIVQYA
jgi:hypothetical protein